ncbi:aminoglycoside adenylyltransferase domain-containing protein [Pseudochrobactrum asaccharolyticum]|uniref:Aminoglycoside (3'') (9) adenylyltransferase n=1 Tax=Pseudochrobactrum asaccharolyticum TaxID=354351 RepID=A0A366DZL2_9HYPH|nr:aminoglycoside adenylyltransferase domain-containing protein [Pseudochrobactrum asaccharolyticum]RBO94704.1 streptomycin 3'-adenylyltransferase [Pseudochrobactrum asaccharolyticum]
MQKTEPEITAQTLAASSILKEILQDKLLGIYIHGSALGGALKPQSDIDLLTVIKSSLNTEERTKLLTALMQLSGRHPAQNINERCLEVMFFTQADLTANEFPARADFVYGEWLRDSFEAGEVPLPNSDPEYTLVLAQAYSEAFALYGPAAQTLLPQITSERIKAAMRILLPSLVKGLHGDERNVLLTLARMLYTATTGQFTSKERAALWAMTLLSERSADLLSYARMAYLGEITDSWSLRQVEGVALADDLCCRISGLLG